MNSSIQNRWRVLTDAEIKEVRTEINKVNKNLLMAFDFSLANPIRIGDLVRLKRKNIKTINGKTVVELSLLSGKKVTYVVVNEEMLSYWDSLPSACDYLFPQIRKDGTVDRHPIVGIIRQFQKIMKSMRIDDFRWHILKHMAFMNYMSNGIGLLKLKKLGIIR